MTTREAHWFSEQVAVTGKLFLPNFADNAARPAVVLAPGWGKTADTMETYAAALASQGMVALTIDYRGWGKSGGLIYLGERIETYDKMRFSEQTPELVIRRGRLDPEHQVQDIRNAVTFLQSEAGVDRTKIGVLGIDVAGGHVISTMGMDARVKVGLAITPVIAGQGEPEKSFAPDAATQAQMIRLARQGTPPRTETAVRARNAEEARLLLAEYKPFWRLDAIPETAAVAFFIASEDTDVDNAANAIAASKALKAKNEMKVLEGVSHRLTAAETRMTADMAASWIKAAFGS